MTQLGKSSLQPNTGVRVIRVGRTFESGALGKAEEEFSEQTRGEAPETPADFDAKDFQSHVHQAIRIAAALAAAEAQPIDGRWALTGILAVARDQGGSARGAYYEIRQLLPRMPIPSTPQIQPAAGAESYPFTAALAASLEWAVREARKHTSDQRLFGREWIACVLLGGKDPALRRVLADCGVSIADIQDAWHRFVTSSDTPTSAGEWAEWWKRAGVPLPDERIVRHGYLAESTTGEDKLQRRSEFLAFARLITDNRIQPPLSIGLLGDWGSGKSFFMEAVQAEARKLEGSAGCCSGMIHIRFNAWHYSDANLWASIVPHIFARTFRAMVPAPDAEDERRRLREQIADAHGAIHAAERQHEDALRNLEDDRERRKKLAADLDFRKKLGAAATRALDRVVEEVGWRKPLGSVADLESAAEDLKDSGERMRAIAGTAIGRRSIGYALLSMLAAMTAASIVAWLGARFGSEPVQRVTEILATLGGSLGSVAAGGAVALARANRVVADFAGELEKTIKEYDRATEADPAIQAKRRELAALDERLAAAKRRLEELEGRLAGLDPSKRLAAFIEDRAGTQDYRAQQGIISLVRKDFEKLSELMKDWALHPESRPKDVRPVERIVLYIDDLDRCSHAVVVQTLEAIHLLLALDLFIVIVGVDSRWLLRSLEKHYADLLTQDGHRGERYRVSTPHNYLEKIFQVTYALAPMSPEGFASFVDHLTGAAALTHGPASADRDRSDPEIREPQAVVADSPPAAGGVERVPLTGTPPDPEAQPDESAEDSDSAARALTITGNEQIFLKKLHPLVPSPRIAKRMTNVYRLVKAGVPWRKLPEFEAAGGRHRPVLLLLAILYGRPAISQKLFRRLSERSISPENRGIRFHDALESKMKLKRLAEAVRAVSPDVTLAECEAEAFELARYSLVTGQVWHTWRRPAR